MVGIPIHHVKLLHGGLVQDRSTSNALSCNSLVRIMWQFLS